MSKLLYARLMVQKGFSLIEIAIVLIIVGLITAGGISSWNAYIDNALQNHTQSNLEQTKRAMLDYVMVNFYMPCPDTNNNGQENREANGTCTSSIGTIPYDDIGRSLSNTSDDYGNVFDYGVNIDVTSQTEMAQDDMSTITSFTTDEVEGVEEASYFASQAIVNVVPLSGSLPTNSLDVELPFFGLDTEMTAAHTVNPSTATSYTICKKTSTNCSSASDYEVQSIPAVIVAYNQNGDGVSLTNCNGQSLSSQETENCTSEGDLNTDGINDNLKLIRQTFSDNSFDDQIVTISAYEIKQQVLDRISGFGLKKLSYEGYDVIYLKNVTSANDINISDDSDNRYYIGANDDGDDGDLEANAVFKGGDDELYMEGTITAAGDLKMGDGDDVLTVEKDIVGSVDTGGDDDTITVLGVISGTVKAGAENDILNLSGNISGSVDAELGFDQITLGGNVLTGGTVSTGPHSGNKPDNDILVFNGSNVAGGIELGIGADEIVFSSAATITGTIDGEGGTDTIRLVGITEAALQTSAGDTDFTDNSGTIRNFEVVIVE